MSYNRIVTAYLFLFPCFLELSQGLERPGWGKTSCKSSLPTFYQLDFFGLVVFSFKS